MPSARIAGTFLLACTMLTQGCCAQGARLKKLTREKTGKLYNLSEDAREIQEAFNVETGKVRLVLLVSPG